MAIEHNPSEVYAVNSYLNTLPNMVRLKGSDLKQFVDEVFDADQKTYHNLRIGLPEEGDTVVWNEFFECSETCGKRRKEVIVNSDILPEGKDCAITSMIVLDVYDDGYKPFARVKEGGLNRNHVKLKISSSPFLGFAIRTVITAKVFNKKKITLFSS